MTTADAERRVYLAAMRAYRARAFMSNPTGQYWKALVALWKACATAERKKGK